MNNVKLASFVIFVDDVLVSKNFYEQFLDQEVSLNIQNINVGFKSGLALWQKQYALKNIFENGTDATGGPANSELYFETSSIDDIYHKILSNKVRVLHAIRVQPWQQRIFRIYDPDGTIIEIGESMEEVVKRLKKEGLPNKSIVEKTFMPKEFVESVLSVQGGEA